ncbi:hypothetical protein ABW19_dt0205296 [Dactylella cylindrospora]|nr:hypothetical protein ABW19_dt0205296 [Dactylella cylindrospora]
MSQFRFRVPGFTRQNPPAASEDPNSASPTNSSALSTKFRITQFVREPKHVDSGKASAGEETHSKKVAADTAVPTENVKSADTTKSSDASEKPSEPKNPTPPGPPIAPKPARGSSALNKSKARRSLPNLKLVPPTQFTPILPFPEGKVPGPVDPSRSEEWNKVVRSIQATSLEAIVTKLLDALSDHPESGPGTLVSHLGDIFLDDATKQAYRQTQSVDPRLLPLQATPASGISVPNGLVSAGTPDLTTPASRGSISKKGGSAAGQRRSLPGAIPKPTPGGVLLAPKLFEPREYKPGSARKLKRKSDADKEGPVTTPLSSVKRNVSAGDLSHPNASLEALIGEEPPVKRKRGRPKGSTKAAIQERESLKMQASAAEQVSETLTETATVATESVSPVQEEERLLPTGTSIELRASSPSPKPEQTL